MITKKDIVKILDKISGNETPYLSEAQFQFELAWELQKIIGENDKILLEYTACAKKASDAKKKKRFESDIIVKFENGTYIAIELKYKTAEAIVNDVHLIQQAGQPGTKYDYLWDIRRIELLKDKNEENEKSYEYYIKDSRCVGGYAIFLTNDSSYWGVPKENTSAYHFSLCDGRIPSEELQWNVAGEELKDWMKSREPFKLSGSYKMKWEVFKEYEHKGNTKLFKYLITTIGDLL